MFWQMHDRLFARQDSLSEEDLYAHADVLGLDVARFARDVQGGRYAARVRADTASAEFSGVDRTPTFFVNAIRHSGPFDAGTLVRRLREVGPGTGDGAA